MARSGPVQPALHSSISGLFQAWPCRLSTVAAVLIPSFERKVKRLNGDSPEKSNQSCNVRLFRQLCRAYVGSRPQLGKG